MRKIGIPFALACRQGPAHVVLSPDKGAAFTREVMRKMFHGAVFRK